MGCNAFLLSTIVEDSEKLLLGKGIASKIGPSMSILFGSSVVLIRISQEFSSLTAVTSSVVSAVSSEISQLSGNSN